MAIPLKQSTASQEVLLGPFLDDTDGKTAETGLSIANTDIKLWFAGGTTESSKNSGGATHIAAGRYYCVLDATDTATLGPMEINVHVSGALPVRRECLVLTAAAYDLLVGTTVPLTVATIADGLMTRASSNWEAAAPVKSLGTAVMKATHKVEDDAGTLKTYRSDGTTVHASQTIGTDPANDPIDSLTGAV